MADHRKVTHAIGTAVSPIVWLATVGFMVSDPSTTSADSTYTVPAPGPFAPTPGPGIPSPLQVSGKEYSDHFDKETSGAHALDPEQNITWRGDGAVADTYDYTGSRDTAGVPAALGDQEVDGFANRGDPLFQSAVANTSALLFPVDGDGSIYSESIAGAGAVWADPAAIDHSGVDDLNALDV